MQAWGRVWFVLLFLPVAWLPLCVDIQLEGGVHPTLLVVLPICAETQTQTPRMGMMCLPPFLLHLLQVTSPALTKAVVVVVEEGSRVTRPLRKPKQRRGIREGKKRITRK